jgi:hypothetical protein
MIIYTKLVAIVPPYIKTMKKAWRDSRQPETTLRAILRWRYSTETLITEYSNCPYDPYKPWYGTFRIGDSNYLIQRGGYDPLFDIVVVTVEKDNFMNYTMIDTFSHEEVKDLHKDPAIWLTLRML